MSSLSGGTTAPMAGRGTYSGLFTVSMATIMYEILLTRLFSVTLYYHLAFMAISLAMFGMTLGALVVYLSPAKFHPGRASRQLAQNSILFAVSMVLSLAAHLFAPLIAESGLGVLALSYVTGFIPFVFSGICVCHALTAFPVQLNRLYAVDLAGAALGCIALIPLLEIVDGLVAVVAVAVLAAVAGILFSRDTDPSARQKAPSITLGILLCLVVILGVAARSGHPMIRMVWVKGNFVPPPIYERWNSFSCVQVLPDSDSARPFGWGISSTFQDGAKSTELFLAIDAIAGTVMTEFHGDFSRVPHLRYDITNLVHYIRPDSRVLIVGAGGGRDILSALGAGQRSVVAVEINPAVLDILNNRFGDFTGHLSRNPRVQFVNDEARSFIARQEDVYDIIQVSLIDTFAATASGAYVLSENSLYTTEAWKIFLDHLSDRGVLSFSRWYFQDSPGEMYRLTSLASSVLSTMGVKNPRSHVIIARNMWRPGHRGSRDGIGTLLVSKEPFSKADVQRVAAISTELNFEMVLTPDHTMDSIFETLASGNVRNEYLNSFPIDISAPTDDRPFFFNMLRFRSIFEPAAIQQGMMTFNMRAVVILGFLLLLVIGLTIAFILIPLLLKSTAGSLRGSGVFVIYFSCIGLGFMLFEIAQLQRLNIFLGHPVYGLSVVLFSLLISGGLGSYLTERRLARFDNPNLRLAVLLMVLLLLGMITPHVVLALNAQSTPVRILVAFALLFPSGLLLGMPFPMGMKLAAGTHPALTPWLWGINGAASVCASVLATALAMAAGISTAYWTSLVFYLGALVCAMITSRTTNR